LLLVYVGQQTAVTMIPSLEGLIPCWLVASTVEQRKTPRVSFLIPDFMLETKDESLVFLYSKVRQILDYIQHEPIVIVVD
jgi:hypothetical protein